MDWLADILSHCQATPPSKYPNEICCLRDLAARWFKDPSITVCETHGDSGAYIRSINVIIYKSEQGEEESERMHADVIWVETPYLAKRISGATTKVVGEKCSNSKQQGLEI